MKRIVFMGAWMWMILVSGTMAHEIPVHERISESAVDISVGLKDFFDDVFDSDSKKPNLGSFLSDGRTHTSRGWIRYGSKREDDKAPPRSKHHFYEPISEQGLTDGADFWGRPSYEWALNGDGNDWSWFDAQNYLFNALTNSSIQDRDDNFGRLFRSLGHVIHLLEDTSQPEHARNDNHFFVTYIEGYEKRMGARAFSYTAQSLNWRVQGINGMRSLRDFWDKDLYIGQQPPPGDQVAMGLAEFTHSNYLGSDALYGELDSDRKFPYPSLSKSTNYDQVKRNPSNFIRPVILADGSLVKRIVISKTKDGVPVNNHSVTEYFLGRGFLPLLPNIFYNVSIDANLVVQEYLDILLPRAVSYSAGLLDYFFRGRMEVEPSTTPEGNVKLTITNISGDQQAFEGGNFSLLWDDETGYRTFLPIQVNWDGSLDNGQSITAEFQPPRSDVASYMLFYQGTIGGDQTAPSIAAKKFSFNSLFVTMNWSPLGSDVDLHLRPPWAACAGWKCDPDCAFYNLHPDWGIQGDRIDDPFLDRDCITSCTIEHITQNQITVPGQYQVLAHYYSDHGKGPAIVNVDVKLNGITVSNQTQILTNSCGGPDCGSLWTVYIIDIQPDGAVSIIPENKIDSPEKDIKIKNFLEKKYMKAE